MRLSNECMKAVLNYVIDNVNVVFDTSNAGYKGVSISSVVEALSGDGKFSESSVLHSCLYAYNLGFIITEQKVNLTSMSPILIKILDVTPSGYKFLEGNN